MATTTTYDHEGSLRNSYYETNSNSAAEFTTSENYRRLDSREFLSIGGFLVLVIFCSLFISSILPYAFAIAVGYTICLFGLANILSAIIIVLQKMRNMTSGKKETLQTPIPSPHESSFNQGINQSRNSQPHYQRTHYQQSSQPRVEILDENGNIYEEEAEFFPNHSSNDWQSNYQTPNTRIQRYLPSSVSLPQNYNNQSVIRKTAPYRPSHIRK
jgi:hypothetical protein